MGGNPLQYWNDKQKAYIEALPKTKVFVGGRGCGKSHVIGISIYDKITAMPRSRGFLSSTTYNQLLTKTWPGLKACWDSIGLKQGVHYVKGKQPPKWFDEPISDVTSHKYLITFCNGSIIELISMDRPDGGRGGSFDHGDIDEAALLKREHFTKVLLPALRGNRMLWKDEPLWQQVGMFSSMPWKSTGLWLLDYEEKARVSPERYFYLTATAYDNLEIIGQEGIDRMKEEMTYLEFEMEVMNKKMVKTEDAFYEGFNTAHHCYAPKYKYATNRQTGEDYTAASLDVDPNALLDVSWDFGRFSCCSVWQEKRTRISIQELMLAAFKTNTNQRLADVVTKFCGHFAGHKFKLVRLWGEPRGHDPNVLMTDSNYDFLTKEFKKRGWRVEVMAVPKQSRKQTTRRTYMTTILAEDTKGYPQLRINQDTCKWAIIAIQNTEADPDGSKNKSTEKDKSFPQEHAPHITDTVDYYFDQKWGPRLSQHTSTRGTAGSADFM